MDEDYSIRTARLVLTPLDRGMAAAILAGRPRPPGPDRREAWADGFPQAGDRRIARAWLTTLAPTAGRDSTAWGPYTIWTRQGDCVGTAGFHGPPTWTADRDGTEVEVGYGIAVSHRGQGLATEAVGALVGVARHAEVRRVLARVDADNPASRAVLDRLGFRVVSDGPEQVTLELSLGHPRHP